jgi:arginine-glutamic acid dipeptide repeat-containing protein
MPRRSVRTRKRETGSNSTSKGSGKTTAKNNPIVDAPANDNGVSSRLRPRPPVPPKGNKSPPNSKGKTNNNKNVNGNKKIRPHPKVKSVALDPSVYVSPSGEEYRPGDFAYVDSQHPDQSYHVCLIKDFKQTRRDSMIAEIVWFFRVQEIPESTYLLLLEDRKSSKWQDVFANNKVKQRELFIAHNVDTHHTSFFRGKCDVKRLEEVDDLHQLISSKDSFFYDLGYSPESRQLTWLNEGNDAYIPYSHQAVVPEVEDVMEYPQREDDYQDKADPVWSPEHSLNDQDLLMYLRSARSVALHAGLWINGYLREGYLAASSDDTTQNAYDVLKDKNFDIREALQDLVKHPNMAKALIQEKCWCADDTTSFTRGVKQFGKNFHKIQQEYFPTRHVSELTQYYYHWKKTTVGLSSRAHRRQNKMRHIRLWKQMGKIPPCQQQEREMSRSPTSCSTCGVDVK